MVFARELKRLAKKHRSLKQDILLLKKDLELDPGLGIDLGDGFRKIRLKITSKGKGKSGGARVVTRDIIISQQHHKIIFVFIWDKSEIKNVNINLLKQFL